MIYCRTGGVRYASTYCRLSTSDFVNSKMSRKKYPQKVPINRQGSLKPNSRQFQQFTREFEIALRVDGKMISTVLQR